MALHELQLAEVRVWRAAEMHEGYARTLQHDLNHPEQPSQAEMLRASSLALAASYRALVLDVQGAKRLFREAAQAYDALQMPFAVLMAICGDDRDLVREYWETRRGRWRSTVGPVPFPAEPFFCHFLMTMSMVVWFGGTSAAHEELRQMCDDGQHDRHVPVGRLGLPFMYYHDIGQALSLATRLEPPLTEYLTRLEAVVMDAMLDQYHWQRLQSAVLPVEPETLAVCLVSSTGFTEPLSFHLKIHSPLQGAVVQIVNAFAKQRER